jgi:protein-disulfide isomerase
MKKYFAVIISIFLVAVFSNALAMDFSLNEPDTGGVTEKTMIKGRAGAVANSQKLLHNSEDVVLGNPDGTITMVQFVDFLCPLSEKMDPAIQALIAANPDLRVVYKPYPLRGEVSAYAAKAAWAANKQGKYQPYHVALMNEGEALTQAKVISLATAQGLDTKQLKADIASGQFNQAIVDSRKLGTVIGIPGTPALFFTKTSLNNSSKPKEVVFMLGSFTQAELQSAIDSLK